MTQIEGWGRVKRVATSEDKHLRVFLDGEEQKDHIWANPREGRMTRYYVSPTDGRYRIVDGNPAIETLTGNVEVFMRQSEIDYDPELPTRLLWIVDRVMQPVVLIMLLALAVGVASYAARQLLS